MQKGKLEMVNLTEIEKFYIEAHRDLKPHKISKRMRKPVTELVVNEYLRSLPPEESKEPNAGDLMGRKVDKGAVVMTEQSSEKSDHFRDKTSNNSGSMEKINEDKIHRIK